MSFLPIDASLQFSDLNNNISHLGVFASNIGFTQSLTNNSTNAFPTTNTGTSLGHYHYTEPSTNALRFLNALGTGQGGHQFWHSSSTQAPVKVFEANRSGTTVNTQFSVDKSTQGSAILIPLPDVTISGASFVITSTPINVPPYNITGIGNPVQVNSNCVNLSTGVTYYATGLSPQSMSICLNADGTGIIDTTDLSSQPQPILSWVGGIGPAVIQTSSLSDDLTIINDTNVSVLSATDLSFNSVSLLSTISDVKVKQIDTINQYISAAIYADGRPPTAPTTTIAQQYAYTPSWYFKNTVAGYKINWYVGSLGLTVSDILGLYLSFFNGSNTSNDNAPFITIYTAPTGTNDFAPNFFHSSMTYIFTGSITANTRYTEFVNLGGPEPNHYLSTLVNLIPSTVNNPRGEYLPTETIAFFAIGSSSAAAVNTVEFAVSKFGIMTATGTTEINYFPN